LAAGTTASGAAGSGAGRSQPAAANPRLSASETSAKDRQRNNPGSSAIADSLHQKRAPWLGRGAWCKVASILEFTKYHALGNDYLVMDAAAFDPGQVEALAPRI